MIEMAYMIWDTMNDKPAEMDRENHFEMRADAETTLAEMILDDATEYCKPGNQTFTALAPFDDMDDSDIADSSDEFEIRRI